MKSEKEQHGHEANTEYARRGRNYGDVYELAPQRKTFGETNKTGAKNAGHDKAWEEAASQVTPQGDGKTGPVTPISGGTDGDIVQPKTRSQYSYAAGGKKYSAEFGRVSDSEQEWKNSGPAGSGEMFPNQGPQTAAFKRPIEIGWKKRYAHAIGGDVQVADAATAPNTPQRRKQRRTESK